MAGYEIRITDAAAKELDALPRKKDRQAVASRILGLAEEPRPTGCVKLSGHEELYRVRQGPYRIVYTIEDDSLVVIVIRVADRKEAFDVRDIEQRLVFTVHDPSSGQTLWGQADLVPGPPPGR